MASKKTKIHKMNAPNNLGGSNSNVQIITHSDIKKSFDELFQPSKERGPLYDKKQIKGRLPPNFFTPRPAARSGRPRGSSAGHSPQGSSDDGFGSTSRNTLSPASVTSVAPPTPFHNRQASAPELDNRGMDSVYSSTSDFRLPQQMMVHHQHSKSVPAIEQPIETDMYVAPHQHIRSVSYDVNQTNPFVQQHIDNQHRYPMQQNFYEQREKSQSLDYLTSQLRQQAAPDDGYGPLPEGWTKSFDPNGDAYFMDHIHKSTTWYDPRLPLELQQEQIHARHACPTQPSYRSMHLQQPHLDHNHPGYMRQQNPPKLDGEYLQKLEMERNIMQERRAQLRSEGLIPPNSPQNFNQPISPMHHGNANMTHDQYGNYGGIPSTSHHLSTPQYAHNRQISDDSTLPDTSMEVDFPTTGNIGYPIDLVNINPTEFDKYLQLSDNRDPPPQF